MKFIKEDIKVELGSTFPTTKFSIRTVEDNLIIKWEGIEQSKVENTIECLIQDIRELKQVELTGQIFYQKLSSNYKNDTVKSHLESISGKALSDESLLTFIDSEILYFTKQYQFSEGPSRSHYLKQIELSELARSAYSY